MRHPNRHDFGQTLKEAGAVLKLDFGVAVLTLVGGANLASQRMHHELQAVADAEHRQTKIKDLLAGVRRAGIVDRARASGKHNAARRVAANLVETGVEREDD